MGLFAIGGISAQTLSKEKKEKYQAKPLTQKKLVKQKKHKAAKVAKKVAKQIKAHPLTENSVTKNFLATASLSTSVMFMPVKSEIVTPVTTAPATIPSSGTIIYSCPNVGLGVLTIQPYQSGWTTLGTVSPSFSYSLGIGEYSTNLDGSLDIQPYVNLGAFVAAGYIPSINSASLQLGASLGVYKYNSVSIGYDVITHKPFLAIGGVISLSTFKKGLASTIIYAQ